MPDDVKEFYYEKAIYTEQQLKKYQGNPYIEALPQIIEEPADLIKYSTYIPEVSEDDRKLSATLRAHLIDSINGFYKPMNDHIEIEQKISRMIRNGYVNRNPYREKRLHIDDDIIKYGIEEVEDSTVAELGIFGISGMGKTTIIRRILSMYPQLILHTNYKGDISLNFQIPWIKVEIQSGCRLKSLSLSILREMDNLFKEEKYYKVGKAKLEYEQTDYLKTVFDIHKVGILVIDEIQNIRGMASKESDKIMKFFVELSNIINVPLVLIGTLKALPLFTDEMKNCRRIADSEPMEKMKNDREWKAFVKALFKLQWTRIPVEVTTELMDILYFESQGNIDIAIKLFKYAQLRAMYTGRERISKDLIISVAKDCLIPLRPLLNALKSNDAKELMKYEDLYQPKTHYQEFDKQEKDKVKKYDQYLYCNNDVDDEDIGVDMEFSVAKSISAFLIQGGMEVRKSEKVATETVKKYGANIDISLLKRRAYEKIAFGKFNEEDTDSNSKNRQASLGNAKKMKVQSSGMLKTINEKESTGEMSGYEALKNDNYISSDNSEHE